MLQSRSLIIWIVVGLCELPVSANLLLGKHMLWSVAIAAHLVAGILAYLAPAKQAQHRIHLILSTPWAVWLALWVLFLPGVGWIFGSIMLVGSRWGNVKAHQDDTGEVLPASALPIIKPAQEPTSRVMQQLDFLPLVEVMACDDIDLKRSAIEQLARLRSPDAMKILLQYRRDPSLEVRFYVNSALSRIKKEFDEALDAARRQMQLDVYKVSARIFLAKIYLQYAQSGLLDHDMVKMYEDEAIFHLTFSIESKYAVPEAFRILVNCYIEQAEWDKALAVVQKSCDVQIGYDLEMQQCYVEILYHMKRFADVRPALQVLQSNYLLPHDWQTTALWWGAS